MKTFLLVFDDGADSNFKISALVKKLDDGAQIYSMDGHVLFIKTGLDVSDLTDRFLEVAGSSLFFVTEVDAAAYSGRMVGTFWSFLKSELVATAA